MSINQYEQTAINVTENNEPITTTEVNQKLTNKKILLIYSLIMAYTCYGFISNIFNIIRLRVTIYWYIEWPILIFFYIGGLAVGIYLGKLKIKFNQEKYHENSALKLEIEQYANQQTQLLTDIHNLKNSLEDSKKQLESLQELKMSIMNENEKTNVNDTVKKLQRSLISINFLDEHVQQKKNPLEHAIDDLAPLIEQL